MKKCGICKVNLRDKTSEKDTSVQKTQYRFKSDLISSDDVCTYCKALEDKIKRGDFTIVIDYEKKLFQPVALGKDPAHMWHDLAEKRKENIHLWQKKIATIFGTNDEKNTHNLLTPEFLLDLKKGTDIKLIEKQFTKQFGKKMITVLKSEYNIDVDEMFSSIRQDKSFSIEKPGVSINFNLTTPGSWELECFEENFDPTKTLVFLTSTKSKQRDILKENSHSFNKEEYILNQIRHFTNSSNDDITFLTSFNNSRLDGLVMSLLVERDEFPKYEDTKTNEVVQHALNFKNGIINENNKDVQKHSDHYKNYQSKQENFSNMMDSLSESQIDILCSTGNVCTIPKESIIDFFINKNPNAMTYKYAQKIIKATNQLNKGEVDHVQTNNF